MRKNLSFPIRRGMSGFHHLWTGPESKDGAVRLYMEEGYRLEDRYSLSGVMKGPDGSFHVNASITLEKSSLASMMKSLLESGEFDELLESVRNG